MDFRITEEIDLFHELLWEMMARMHHYMDRHQITDKKHPLYVLVDQVNCVTADMLGSRYKTMNDVMKLKGQYEFMWSYMNALEEGAKQ